MRDLNNWSVRNFTRAEVACRCNQCGHISNMQASTMEKFQRARDWIEQPIYGNSFCRCRDHNLKVGGKEDSSHICSEEKKACAGDVTLVPEDQHRPMTSKERLLLVMALLEGGFRRLGISEWFVHGDDSPEKPSPAMWLY